MDSERTPDDGRMAQGSRSSASEGDGSLPPVTVAIINHDGMATLPAVVDALLASDYPDRTVVLVDDHSTDGSPEWFQETHPELPVLRTGPDGGRASVGRNLALRWARTPFVFLVDNDVVVRPDAVGILVETLATRPDVFACSPRLVYARDPDRIYFGGSNLHYLAVSCDASRGLDVTAREAEEPFPSLCNGILLVRREVAVEMGGFDTEYAFGWGEDGELPVRAILGGWRCLHVPGAVATHVEKRRGTARAEAQIQNRIRMLLTVYSGRSLLLLAPALLAFEVALAGAAVAKGFAGDYLRAARGAIGALPAIRARRATIQASREASDRALLCAGDLTPTGALSRSWLVRAASRAATVFFGGYWWVVRPFLGRR
jgi:GT2 family glycosyltransferase